MRSLRTGKYLFIEAPRRELYDLAADPKAEHNLAATSKAVADTLQGQLNAFRQKTAKNGEAPRLPTDPTVQEKLAALGYMAASTLTPAAPDIGTGADPKDKIEVGNMMTNANCLLEETRYDEAAVLLKQVIAKEPKMTIAYAKLGTAEVGLQNFPEAIKAKRKALELLPGSPDLRFELGKVLVMAQEYEAAIPELEAVEKAIAGIVENPDAPGDGLFPDQPSAPIHQPNAKRSSRSCPNNSESICFWGAFSCARGMQRPPCPR